MKVLVVGTGGALGGSGITTMADQMTRTLAEMGHEPTRLVAGARRRARPNRLNLQNTLAVFTEAVTIARAARSTRTDIVWLHTFGVPTLPAIRTLAQILAVRAVRRPIIVELHAFALADHVASPGRLLQPTLRMVGRMSRRIVVLQEADARALRHHVAPDKVVVLPNWVEVPAEPKPLPPGPPFTAVFVGGLVVRKGVPQLLEAMRLLEAVPIRLRLVGGAGDDGEAAAAALRASAADLVSDGRVEFMGELDPAGVRAELAQAHLLVLPSRAEGLPMSMLEALAECRPVVVGNAGGMADLVRRSGAGIVLDSSSAAVIAGGLRDAVSDLQRLAIWGQSGREEVMRLAQKAAISINELLERALPAQSTESGGPGRGSG